MYQPVSKPLTSSASRMGPSQIVVESPSHVAQGAVIGLLAMGISFQATASSGGCRLPLVFNGFLWRPTGILTPIVNYGIGRHVSLYLIVFGR